MTAPPDKPPAPDVDRLLSGGGVSAQQAERVWETLQARISQEGAAQQPWWKRARVWWLAIPSLAAATALLVLVPAQVDLTPRGAPLPDMTVQSSCGTEAGADTVACRAGQPVYLRAVCSKAPQVWIQVTASGQTSVLGPFMVTPGTSTPLPVKLVPDGKDAPRFVVEGWCTGQGDNAPTPGIPAAARLLVEVQP